MENPSPRILFVDDEATAVKYFQRAIGPLAPVIAASSVEEGIALLHEHAASLAVLVSDQRMPGRFGNELLRHAREYYPHMVRILTTAYSEIEFTVEAINEGQIHRYIKKPWEISALRMELRQALELADLRVERDVLLREKMQVRQRQLLAHRVGMLDLLCGGRPVPWRDAYLGAAQAAGACRPEADFQQLDYADLVEAESLRAAQFMQSIEEARAALRPAQDGWALLEAALPGQLAREGEALRFLQPDLPTEFLAGPVHAPVSAHHAAWVAALEALQAAGWTVRGGVLARLAVPRAPAPLAAWIEQFLEAPVAPG